MKKEIATYNSDLGILSLYMVADKITPIEKTNNRKIFKTNTHHIELILFDEIKEWMSKTKFPIDNSKGWIIRITKIKSENEELIFNCNLNKIDREVFNDVDCGEHLDSIYFENKKAVMNIGTEDAEVLKRRALENDWMPNRFKNFLGIYFEKYSITEIINYEEFETKIPNLEINEKIYFHYLIASKVKANIFDVENDISTNIAVDFSKRYLVEKLNIE
ncbi:hypothetical protein [Tenacibaculum ovolyticum]|uniref:hypothetical protein n=1 Tax=Tenacibaculum ovolyticum TaxID=104270 RepID=UPI003BA8768E